MHFPSVESFDVADASTNRRALRHYGVTHIIALGKVIAPEWPDSSTLLLEHVDEDGDLVAMLPNILGFITTALRYLHKSFARSLVCQGTFCLDMMARVHSTLYDGCSPACMQMWCCAWPACGSH